MFVAEGPNRIHKFPYLMYWAGGRFYSAWPVPGQDERADPKTWMIAIPRFDIEKDLTLAEQKPYDKGVRVSGRHEARRYLECIVSACEKMAEEEDGNEKGQVA